MELVGLVLVECRRQVPAEVVELAGPQRGLPIDQEEVLGWGRQLDHERATGEVGQVALERREQLDERDAGSSQCGSLPGCGPTPDADVGLRFVFDRRVQAGLPDRAPLAATQGSGRVVGLGAGVGEQPRVGVDAGGPVAPTGVGGASHGAR